MGQWKSSFALLFLFYTGLIAGDQENDLTGQTPAPITTVHQAAPAPDLPPSARNAPGSDDLGASFQQGGKKGFQGNSLVRKSTVTPHWFAGNTRFWYKNDLKGGNKEFILVDAEKGTREPAFDHQKLAVSLSKVGAATYRAERLPFDVIDFVDDGKAVRFTVGGVNWKCDLASYECMKSEKGPSAVPTPPTEETEEADEPNENPAPEPEREQPEPAPQKKQPGKKGGQQPAFGAREARSPNGQWTAFIKDYNLHLRDKDGKETALTTDGVEKNAYGALQWSPDGQSVVFHRNEPGDNRSVQRIETCPTDGSIRTVLHTQVYPQPGDKFAAHEMWVYNLEGKKSTKVETDRVDFKGPPRPRWLKDGRHFTFEHTDRGHQPFRIIEVDSHTGKVRNLYDEKTETSFVDHYSFWFMRYLGESEIIISSEVDGWKHLYLLDAKTGKIKNQITKGEWVVRAVDRVDEQKRQIWFKASGKNAGQDPYLIHYYRINFDGTGLVDLTEGNGNHVVTYSPDGKFLIDSYSRLDLAPVTELRRVADGKLVVALEKADVAELEATGWRYPEVFTAKGRDGKTDIWGVVHRPRKLEPLKKYPVVEYIYAGPHSSHVPKTFSSNSGLAALAELGFVVVQIDGMGTGNRSRAFHDVCWKNLADAGFPDRILWIKALAKKHVFLDISKVGIYGTSAGGQNALGALLFHGDFYSCAMAACGCHDNRIDKQSWNEQWMGLYGAHYKAQSNVTNAHKLKGKVLLIVGELDNNVPPESTYQVVNALIKANKTFDLITVPGMGHSDGGLYGRMRMRDFFVRHLQGVEPPDRNK